MCDVKKYEKIYEEIKCLEPEDTLQLTLEADSEEQREFYQIWKAIRAISSLPCAYPVGIIVPILS